MLSAVEVVVGLADVAEPVTGTVDNVGDAVLESGIPAPGVGQWREHERLCQIGQWAGPT